MWRHALFLVLAMIGTSAEALDGASALPVPAGSGVTAGLALQVIAPGVSTLGAGTVGYDLRPLAGGVLDGIGGLGDGDGVTVPTGAVMEHFLPGLALVPQGAQAPVLTSPIALTPVSRSKAMAAACRFLGPLRLRLDFGVLESDALHESDATLYVSCPPGQRFRIVLTQHGIMRDGLSARLVARYGGTVQRVAMALSDERGRALNGQTWSGDGSVQAITIRAALIMPQHPVNPATLELDAGAGLSLLFE